MAENERLDFCPDTYKSFDYRRLRYHARKRDATGCGTGPCGDDAPTLMNTNQTMGEERCTFTGVSTTI